METNTDLLYQRIGEFAVSFQWIEHLVRQIGWLISDPHRKKWPPLILRVESNTQLLTKVEHLYCRLIERMNLKDSETRKINFKNIIQSCHELRKYRNTLFHSAFIELKAGGEVKSLLRSNPKIKADKKTGEYIFDQEILTDDGIKRIMEKAAIIALNLNFVHIQLIHWAPFKLKHNDV